LLRLGLVAVGARYIDDNTVEELKLLVIVLLSIDRRNDVLEMVHSAIVLKIIYVLLKACFDKYTTVDLLFQKLHKITSSRHHVLGLFDITLIPN
jgi:hypothetical protein